MKKSSLSVVGVFMLLLANVAVLAQPNLDVQQVAEGMKKNQEVLSNYAWQSRVSVSIDGEEKKVDLYQVRYNMSGELEKTRMGGEADEKKVRGPVRKRMAKSKKRISKNSPRRLATRSSLISGRNPLPRRCPPPLPEPTGEPCCCSRKMSGRKATRSKSVWSRRRSSR